MNRLLRKLAPIFLATAALAVAGCGDDDSDETSGSEPLSKQEFIVAADEICASGDAEIDEGGQAFAGTEGEKVDELVGTVIAPGYREQIDQLSELVPPEADQAQIDEFLSTFETGVDQLEENPDQIVGGQAVATILEARQLARAYGMEACARGAAATGG